MTEPWTSVEELARHLGVAKDSIYRWIERRNLPAHRIGRHWKFKVSEVDDWVRVVPRQVVEISRAVSASSPRRGR